MDEIDPGKIVALWWFQYDYWREQVGLADAEARQRAMDDLYAIVRRATGGGAAFGAGRRVCHRPRLVYPASRCYHHQVLQH